MIENHPSRISILDFTYNLPQEKIATYPLAERDVSKLLVYKNKKISESRFKNLADALEPGTLLVFNETKVIRARLLFSNAKGQEIELFCLEPAFDMDLATSMSATGPVQWKCLVGNLKRWKDERLVMTEDGLALGAKIIEKQTQQVVVEFDWHPNTYTFSDLITHFGKTPIPPYLNRQSERIDEDRYQTVYAHREGSVAAPTAGLHFTPEVFSSLRKKNISDVSLVLHVSAGTFKPVKASTMAGHEMHAEWMEVKYETLEVLAQHTSDILAVGTTSLRSLESIYWMGLKCLLNPDLTLKELEPGQWEVYDLMAHHVSKEASVKALQAWMKRNNKTRLVCHTAILIAPPYRLRMCKGIITNFHQPQSTLLLLVSSIVGKHWREIYDYALTHDFRFLSYGDSSLLFADETSD